MDDSNQAVSTVAARARRAYLQLLGCSSEAKEQALRGIIEALKHQEREIIEANRQDRSLSWIVQQAWRIARNEIMRFPSVNDVVPDDKGD